MPRRYGFFVYIMPIFLFIFLILIPSYTLCKPDDTIIAFDIHNVIMQKNIWSMIKTVWNYPQKYQLITHTTIYNLGKTLMLICQGQWKTACKLCKDHNPYLAELLNKLGKTRKPIEGTVKTIQQLKEMGYQLHILSNSSQEAYNNVKVTFPQIFDLFDVAHITTIKKGKILKKPDPAFFDLYLKMYNTNNKQIVLIDDQPDNVETAQQCGFIGILFENPHQLQQELKNRNIIE